MTLKQQHRRKPNAIYTKNTTQKRGKNIGVCKDAWDAGSTERTWGAEAELTTSIPGDQ
jgi:hypothetical protein